MSDTALSALVLAWTTTTIATTLFAAALAFSRVWETTTYFRGLQSILGSDM